MGKEYCSWWFAYKIVRAQPGGHRLRRLPDHHPALCSLETPRDFLVFLPVEPTEANANAADSDPVESTPILPSRPSVTVTGHTHFHYLQASYPLVSKPPLDPHATLRYEPLIATRGRRVSRPWAPPGLDPHALVSVELKV